MAESDMKKMATEIWKSVDVKIEKKKESFIAPKW